MEKVIILLTHEEAVELYHLLVESLGTSDNKEWNDIIQSIKNKIKKEIF